MNLKDLAAAFAGLSDRDRPVRLRLSHKRGLLNDVLLVKRVTGHESLCGGLEYRLLCLSTRADLPLKEFIALPVELQFVTDRGDLRDVCGIVAQAAAGQSDGGLATYQLVMLDALALMDQRVNTRVFRNINETELSAVLLSEWRANNPILANSFDIDMSRVSGAYPAREFIMQYNESDAMFLQRLWKRRGISWFIRPRKASNASSDRTPAHTLVLFDSSYGLEPNAAGTVRFRQDRATQTADSINNWCAQRALKNGCVTRQSWDYRRGVPMSVQTPTIMQQGEAGTQFAFGLDDYLVEAPHIGDDAADYRSLGKLRMQRHEYEAKCFHGEGGVRDFCVGEWFRLEGHPEIDSHPDDEREFVLTELWLSAENNLPKTVDEQARRLFAINGWNTVVAGAELETASEERDVRYTNRFSCVRRAFQLPPISTRARTCRA